jgi:hypothetical protein
VKFIHIAQHVVNDTNYETQVVKNPDKQNSQLALEKLIQIAIRSRALIREYPVCLQVAILIA